MGRCHPVAGPGGAQKAEPQYRHKYGVATISSLIKIIGLFCKRAL